MPTIDLEFPILVEQTKSNYHVKPLLFPGPKTSAPRYGNALKFFARQIRANFRNMEMNRHNVETLLWYRFSPDLIFETERFVFRSGMHFIDGPFAVAYYSVKGHKYACFPGLNHHTFRIEVKEKGRTALLHYLTDKLIQYFQYMKKESEEAFASDQQYSAPNASTSLMDVSIETQAFKFEFEKEEDSLFAFFSQDSAFDGAEELEKVAEDIGQDSFVGNDISYYRERESQWLERILFGKRPQAAVIVGSNGLGKSNLVNDVYRDYLEKNQLKPSPQIQKVWRLDPLRVISGMSIVGQWERRFESVLCHIRDRITNNTNKRHNKPDILLVSNPVALLRIGKTSQTELTLAHLLIPYIERREFPVVLEATPQEWQKVQDMNRSFADLFQVMRLEPLDESQLDFIITKRRAEIERQFDCEFAISGLMALIKSEPSLRGAKELPGSLVDMIRSIAITSQNRSVDAGRVYASLQENFHINRDIIDQSATLSRKSLTSYFSENLIGQPEAVEVMVETVLSIKARLVAPGKPLNTLLFIGPTGVGKTEASKLLAQYLFTKEESLVRIDMNEFVDASAVERLIGGDFNPYGILTEQVRYQKSCVVLLDEIEKAHPRVHDLLLQLLDDGRLTDAAGNTTDFSQTVILLTSNVGAQDATNNIGFVNSKSDQKATYQKSLEQHFRPEMLNRINNVVVFNSLAREHMKFLAKLHLNKLLRRDGFVRRSTILNVDEDCLAYIADQGYDPQLGARALKRNLERIITHSTARQLAEAKADEPIVLNMWREAGKVRSDIVRLEYADRNSISVPDAIQFDLSGYRSLLSQLQEEERRISESDKVHSEYAYIKWTLLDTIRNITEPLQSFIYELEDRSLVKNMSVGFSFKPVASKMYELVKRPRIDFASLHAHHDIRSYMDDIFSKSQNFFVLDKANDYDLWKDANRLMHLARSYSQRGVDNGYLLVQSLVTHKGKKAVSFLSSIYQSLIGELGHVEMEIDDNDGVLMKVSGPGITELFQHESGVHILYEEGNVQIPIVVRYYEGVGAFEHASFYDKRQRLSEGSIRILRLYAMADNDKNIDGTVTDIRTGLMTESCLSGQWWVLGICAFPDYLEVNDAT